MYPKEYINCDQEPIHICGHVQKYGWLVGTQNSKITFYSENILNWINKKPEDFLGKDIKIFFQELDIDINWNNFSYDETLAIQHITYEKEDYTLAIHSHNGNTFFEIEKVKGFHKINEEYNTLQNILRESNGQNVWKILLQEIQRIIDFDRVMIYQFLYEGSGQVIEEIVRSNLESYLHLYYPESDIPAQARALYLKNTVRITPDVFAETYPICGLSQENIDLTYSTIRASSPVHVQYLKNADAGSSFSTSIIVNGKLWGLVACQNQQPKYLDLQTRFLAETLTKISANAFSSFRSLQTLQDFQKVNLNNITLRQNLLNEESFIKGLRINIQEIMKVSDADGMVIKINDEILTAGISPSISDLEKITLWVAQNNQSFEDNLFISDKFSRSFADTLEKPENVCGVIFSTLGTHLSDYLLWIRKEQTQDINWAGNPEKIQQSSLENGKEVIRFSPRKSFEVWKENVKGLSLPWKTREIEAAKWITSIILKMSHAKSSQILDLNKQLKELNEELDSFSYTISHDLNTPLTVIRLNAQLLKRLVESNDKTDKGINNIITEVDNMSEMIKHVLELSRIKKTEISLKKIELNDIISKLAEDSKLSLNSPKTEIVIENTPEVLGDKTMIYQVFVNIIGNAVKYSSKSNKPKVTITGEISDQFITYKVSDNGIGIAEKDAQNMFKIFSRMDNAKDFNGNGVGLSIVHRLMEKMGGQITYESKQGIGSTFILKFQKPDYDFSIS